MVHEGVSCSILVYIYSDPQSDTSYQTFLLKSIQAFGSKSQFPFPWLKNEDGTQVQLKPKDKFASWWDSFGASNPIKESSTISNFGESNYLSKHVEGTPALVHGLNLYKDWNPYEHVSTKL